MKDDFKDETTFQKDLTEILLRLLAQPLEETLVYSLDTHDMQGIKKILEILTEYRYSKLRL